MVEVGLAEAGGAASVASDLPQQPSEALAGEGGLGDLAPAEGGPQVVVDPPVGGEGGPGTGKTEGSEGVPEGRTLGLVEIQEGVVDVEEDGAETVQATTWPGR